VEATFESAPDAPSRARRRVDGLADQLPARALADLRTVVTELVTNCVRHGAGAPIDVAIEVGSDGAVRGCVGDGGRGHVAIGPARAQGEGGLGLRIVDALASRWGVRAPTTDVWFELAAAT
jgi:anti-sigma regulatory factor (Ser/Thr protein kinase)